MAFSTRFISVIRINPRSYPYYACYVYVKLRASVLIPSRLTHPLSSYSSPLVLILHSSPSVLYGVGGGGGTSIIFVPPYEEYLEGDPSGESPCCGGDPCGGPGGIAKSRYGLLVGEPLLWLC